VRGRGKGVKPLRYSGVLVRPGEGVTGRGALIHFVDVARRLSALGFVAKTFL
jgi:hypothetical protein